VLLRDEGMSAMRACNCGKARRAIALTKWALPATILALLPKCPACVAAWVLLATGVGMTLPTAALVRTSVWGLCVGAISWVALGFAWRLVRR
jgi:hypothetical protein